MEDSLYSREMDKQMSNLPEGIKIALAHMSQEARAANMNNKPHDYKISIGALGFMLSVLNQEIDTLRTEVKTLRKSNDSLANLIADNIGATNE